MFRTSKCSSSERFVHAVLWYFFMHPYKQSGWCQDVFGTIQLHVKVFLRMNTWLFETCRRQYNWITIINVKCVQFLVLIAYIYIYISQFKKRKVCNLYWICGFISVSPLCVILLWCSAHSLTFSAFELYRPSLGPIHWDYCVRTGSSYGFVSRSGRSANSSL